MKTQCTPTRATDHKHINHGTISVVRVPYPSRRIRNPPVRKLCELWRSDCAPPHIYVHVLSLQRSIPRIPAEFGALERPRTSRHSSQSVKVGCVILGAAEHLLPDRGGEKLRHCRFLRRGPGGAAPTAARVTAARRLCAPGAVAWSDGRFFALIIDEGLLTSRVTQHQTTTDQQYHDSARARTP